jgi:hypothetical protein
LKELDLLSQFLLRGFFAAQLLTITLQLAKHFADVPFGLLIIMNQSLGLLPPIRLALHHERSRLSRGPLHAGARRKTDLLELLDIEQNIFNG